MAVNITEAMIEVLIATQPNMNKDKNTAWAFPNISFDIAPGFNWYTSQDDAMAINIAENWLKRLMNAASASKSIVGGYLNYIDPYLGNWQRLREINSV
jgi:hypothetical protein